MITKKESNMRSCLPYGKWTLEDRSEILFNRKYIPLGSENKKYDNIVHSKTIYFYDDATCPWDSKESYTKYMNKLQKEI